MKPESAIILATLSLAGFFLLWIIHLYRKLRVTEQYRRDLILNISHEFLTPLTVIKGYTETLLFDIPDPRQAGSQIKIIQSNADRLMRLVEDLLTISRMENVNPRERLSLVDLSDFFDELYHRFRSRLEAKGIGWSVDLADPVRNIETDRGILEIIFTNLIDNAVKYSGTSEPCSREGEASVPLGGMEGALPAPVIEIRGKRHGSFIQFDIKDSGIGISREDQKRIFERFYRVNKDRSRESGGTGLGLAIVKHAVSSLGGKIGVESKPDRGSIFYFSIKS